jgi:pimeloyl-ACP methyl ester carboxylesterase
LNTLQVDGTEVLIEGNGEDTLVMIHGWPDTRALWDPQVACFSPHLRCVRFTLPGNDLRQGRRPLTLAQMTAHIAAIVDATSPGRPVTLLLHDWGAVYGYQFAMQHPGRVARIVGVDIGDTRAGDFLRSLSWKARLGIAAYQLWLALAYQLPAALGDRMTRRMARLLRAPAPPEAIAAQMNHPYVAAWSGGLSGAVRVKPHCPMLYLYGERKPFMFHGPAWVASIAAAPGSAVHGLRAGHWVMVNQPEDFNRIVGRWLGLPIGVPA